MRNNSGRDFCRKEKRAGKKRGYIAKPLVCMVLLVSLLAGTVPVSADDTEYQTMTVTKGTMAVKSQMPAGFIYTGQVPVVFESECGSTTFISYLVNINDYVGKGDPIAQISTGVDEIALEETKLRIQRAEESRDRVFADMQEQHDVAKRAVAESSGTQRRIAELRLEQLEMEQERNKRQVEEEVAVLQEQLAAYEEAIEVTQILAPVSGQVTWLNYFSHMDKIWDGTKIGEIACMDELMFAVKDTGSVLRYGMRVYITNGQGENGFAATIVSSGSKYLSSSFNGERAILKPDSQSADVWGFNMTYENIHIDNALLISTAAVRRDKNGSYVVELKDGKLIKRYFTVGKTVNDLCYAIDGLTEGMTVVVQ